jgi:hypothetical protein
MDGAFPNEPGRMLDGAGRGPRPGAGAGGRGFRGTAENSKVSDDAGLNPQNNLQATVSPCSFGLLQHDAIVLFWHRRQSCARAGCLGTAALGIAATLPTGSTS